MLKRLFFNRDGQGSPKLENVIARLGLAATIFSVLSVMTMTSHAFNGITFTDIAEGDQAGIEYRSHEMPSDVLWDELKAKPVFSFEDVPPVPLKSRGFPGVAIFDYDRDGDVDMYISDTSQTHSSVLYANQLKETGELSFNDATEEAGLLFPEHGGTGVCFADTDNDGDQDLYALGIPESRFFENNGDGTFTDKSSDSGLNLRDMYPSSCSFGDINGDGLVDLAIANSYDNWDHRLPVRLFEFGNLKKPNQVLLNKGGNVFEDISEASGIQNVSQISWAIALVDYDLDGDLDLFSADDQGPKRPAEFGGTDDGYVRVYNNDGTGHFTDVTEQVGTNRFGAWMGLSFGDYNRDGNMDFFGTNMGAYLGALAGDLVGGGDWSSTWYLAQGDGSFEKSGSEDLGGTPFGWGTSSSDYDNDGDTDIIFAGGLDIGTFVASNPGAVLNNDGIGHFNRDGDALPNSSYHLRRHVQGLAVADMNNDGYMDIIDVSNMNWLDFMPLVDYAPLGGQFDGVAKFWPTFSPVNPQDPFEGFTWNGVDPLDGTLSVKINSARNHNNWVKVQTIGTVGLTSDGMVNRDGIGAVMIFTPKRGEPVMTPVLSGASHNSSHALEVGFGLGAAQKGTLEIIWPGGVRNKLYNVRASERVVFPEIPWSYDTESMSFETYKACVRHSLNELRRAGVLTKKEAKRFRRSAKKAFRNHHNI